MVRSNRTAGRWLDSFPRLLGLAFVVLLAGLSMVPRVARASIGIDYTTAMSRCQSYRSSNPVPAGWTQGPCIVMACDGYSQAVGYHVDGVNGSGQVIHNISGCNPFDGSPPSNPCTTLPTVTSTFGGRVLSGYTLTQNATDPTTGNLVPCAMTFTPKGVPTYSQYGWQTYGTLSPTGNPASSGAGQGVGTWSNTDGSAPSNPPADVPTLPTTSVAPPQVCGGGSCYDPSTDSYCATAGGAQVCVSGPSGRSTSGACAYGGGGAVCSGATLPPIPVITAVPDPSTDIRSSDHTTQADPTTGNPVEVTTNVYATPDVNTSNGQQAGDAGPGNTPTKGNDQPASSSSTGTPGSYSGGANCNTPPVCTGDAATCGAARQQWYAMCTAHADSDQLHKDLTGDGSTPSIPPGPSKSDVWTDGTTTGDGVADNANAGSYDTSGFGFSTQCPMTDLTVPLWDGKSFTFAMSKGCVVGPWLHGIIIAFALFAAAKITAGAA